MNESIGLWNCTFGNAEFLEYRDDLRIALSKLKSVTEMKLPNFPEDDMEVSELKAFMENTFERVLTVQGYVIADSLHRFPG